MPAVIRPRFNCRNMRENYDIVFVDRSPIHVEAPNGVLDSLYIRGVPQLLTNAINTG